MRMRRRSQARMLALQALCLYDALGEAFEPQLEEFLNDEEVYADLGIEYPPHPEVVAFARTLAAGAWACRHEYDQLLNRGAPQWTVARMSLVDRNVLRLGLHELRCHPEVPHQVVINEAVDLARRFGDTDSAAFVNGLLDALRREMLGGGAGPGRAGGEAAELPSAVGGPSREPSRPGG